MPTPIQLGSLTDRLRKFLRIRGKLPLLLDEVVVPTVLIQDLTVGPYQAGVTPASGSIDLSLTTIVNNTIAVFLQDKPQSITPVLGDQFEGRSFSTTWIDMQAIDPNIIETVVMELTDRARLVAAGIPVKQIELISIQENPNGLTVPVAMATFPATTIIPTSGPLWQGRLEGISANNSPTVRIIEPIPQNTIGPEDVIIVRFISSGAAQLFFNIRGFYQQQPS